MAGRRTRSAGCVAWKRPTTKRHPASIAFASTAIALALVWLVAPRSRIAAWAVGSAVAAILLFRTGASDFGLRFARLRSAVRRWWPLYAGCIAVFVVVVRWRSLNAPTVTGSAAYFAGCVVQQLIFQQLICRPVSEEYGPGEKAQWSSALLFSLVHLPNWVLAPATFIWGAAAWGLYRRDRSLWAVAILQYLLSGVLYGVVPYGWHHGFRVGPRY